MKASREAWSMILLERCLLYSVFPPRVSNIFISPASPPPFSSMTTMQRSWSATVSVMMSMSVPPIWWIASW